MKLIYFFYFAFLINKVKLNKIFKESNDFWSENIWLFILLIIVLIILVIIIIFLIIKICIAAKKKKYEKQMQEPKESITSDYNSGYTSEKENKKSSNFKKLQYKNRTTKSEEMRTFLG